MPDWTNQGSSFAKELLLKRWPGGTPPVVWYDLGTRYAIGEPVPGRIIAPLINTFYPNFQELGVRPDISTHLSHMLKGHMLLRAVRPIHVPLFLAVDGRECPLYQVGNEDGGRLEVKKTNGVVVNFLAHWETPEQEDSNERPSAITLYDFAYED